MTHFKSLYSAKQAYDIDQYLIHNKSINSLDLMAKAAFACFNEIQKQCPQRIVVIAGYGNNAGDGFMIAALTHMANIDTRIFTTIDDDRLTPDTQYMLKHAKSLGIDIKLLSYVDHDLFEEAIKQANVVVDALFGTGINRDISGYLSTIVKTINAHSRYTLSVDVPSGVCASTGKLFSCAIKANTTVSFVCNKIGLYTGEAPDYVGNLIYAPLVSEDMFDSSLQPQATLLDHSDLKSYISHLLKCKTINKNDKGNVGIIAGDKGMSGAAIMTATAALIIGAGRVSLFTHKEHATFINLNQPEIMCYGVEQFRDVEMLINKLDVLVIGPGMVESMPWSQRIITEALKFNKTMIIDAGALDFLKSIQLRCNQDQLLITPHEGEAARILNTTASIVRNNRIELTKTLADHYHTQVLLKGAGTLLYTENKLKLCRYGHPILATAGSGDLLTGMIAGLAAQLQSVSKAAEFAVLLQGIASEKYAKEKGVYGFSATKLLQAVVDVLNEYA